MLKHSYFALGGLLSVCLFASPAFAHEAVGPNGGKLVDAGSYHVELVAKGRTADVFLTDANDKPVPAAGFKGTAILVVDGKPQRLILTPADGNRLTGAAGVDLPKAPKGAVQIQPPAGAMVQGKF